MLAFTAALAVALQGASVQGPQFDTTFAAARGDRLEAHVFSGSIAVRTWNRDQVRVQASGMEEAHERARRSRVRPGGLDVSRSGGTIRVQLHPGRSGDGEGHVTIWVPAATSVELQGNQTGMTVEGIQAAVRATTIEGDITVTGGGEFVELSSVDGDITVSGVRGRLQANSVDGAIVVRDARGAVSVNTVDGAIELTDVDGPNVQANTVDGDIAFRGPVRSGGTYRLVSHDGDVSATLAGTADAEVSISTFSGEFETDMPVTITGTARAGHQFSFTLGRGGAQVFLETFDGTIRLGRTGR
jgi:DUF4097 and DUF4098 domain-containing protein YvlB